MYRKVVIFGYAYRWMGGAHRAMSLVQPDEAVLAQVDDVGKQLLGATNDGLIDWAKQHDIFPEPTPWVMEFDTEVLTIERRKYVRKTDRCTS